MKNQIRNIFKSTLYITFLLLFLIACKNENQKTPTPTIGRSFNSSYEGKYLDKIAFPIGGIGAGMIALEGTGAVSHVSIRSKPDLSNEPLIFSAICLKGKDGNITKVLEGPVPDRKVFGKADDGFGLGGTTYGLPRYQKTDFTARFPFAEINLKDSILPLDVKITGWSPFIPTDPDNSSLPVGAFEFTIKNNSAEAKEGVYSFNATNFLKVRTQADWNIFEENKITPLGNGFVLSQSGTADRPHIESEFAFFTDDNSTAVDHCWFRGSWFDPLTITWKKLQDGMVSKNAPVQKDAPGASLFVPFDLKPGEEKTIKLMFCWYAPKSNEAVSDKGFQASWSKEKITQTYAPWYSGKFKNIEEVASYWKANYADLKKKSELFRDAFYASTLPAEVLEAVSANLTVLKSPTVLRQPNGRLWGWEGCGNTEGSCHGSCTHVWNYAQAVPHLFPSLERSFRETEFNENQFENGYQNFRALLPIRVNANSGTHAAADGQLGGMMKIYRDWKISGDTEWLKKIWPKVKISMDYCIKTWDPKHKGIVEEPHHNTYDIEFWGPDGMITGFYLGALTATTKMGTALGEDVSQYQELLSKGKAYLEKELYNGEYFYQQIKWEGLEAANPMESTEKSFSLNYSPEAKEIFKKEGPKYQYGTGCLSDGVLGLWIAQMAGIQDTIVDPEKIKSHLRSVYKYNLKHDLSEHSNPQRPGYAIGKDGGLLLCTWPKGGKLSLPFVYSNEVWTGIEYQAASHMILTGLVEEGLDVVRTCRKRYDGITRNPFNEYECGNWYARAMSSYGLLQALTGIRYDALDQVLYFDSRIGDDFTSFISTEKGFGNAGMKGGKPFLDVKYGIINVKKCLVKGAEMPLTPNN